MARFFAHTGLTTDSSDWQPLLEHLIAVSAGSARRARQVDMYRRSAPPKLECQATLAGWLHDVGKYRGGFQDYLFHRPVARELTYHKQTGAAKAASLGYVPTAFAIAGHHGEIPARAQLRDAVGGSHGNALIEEVWDTACRENPALATLAECDAPYSKTINIDFVSRIILSCLVDADWEDTSNFDRSLKGLAIEPPPPSLAARTLLERLLAYVARRAASCPDITIREIRGEILQASLAAAIGPPGIYSLTVPTGGGKTLSSLAFALRHSQEHELRRIIYVAPYLSIIDQNTNAIREALDLTLDDPILFAHHSLSEPDQGDHCNETALGEAVRRAENWDAPIVVTTNVQFFESLFSNKPSRCRKLHNLSGSVILLDECQTIPPGFVQPTCAMLRQLTHELHCTIVLCTATQPVFNHPVLPSEQRLEASEIIPTSLSLFSRLSRVRLNWPMPNEFLSWNEVANRLSDAKSKNPAGLCIVNSRRAARELFAELRTIHEDGVFHLSTSMCPAHRMSVLNEVRERLHTARKCLLVSTQLIEAGVDVDFPVVMREMAPLEAIIQAAGRCNREGLLAENGRRVKGNVIIFRSTAFRDEPSRYYPSDQWYKAGLTTLDSNFLAAGRLPEIDRADHISDYYMRLFHSGRLDDKDIHRSRTNLDFKKVAEDYRIIRDNSVAVIIGTWESHRATVDSLLEAVKADPSRANFRKLASYQVNVRRHELASPAGSVIARPFEQLELRVWFGPYDEYLGMSTDETDMLMVV